MMEKTKVKEFLDSVPPFELQPYFSEDSFSQNHIPFVGVPNRHKERTDKMVLVTELGTGLTAFCEFFINDIDRIENIETMIASQGNALPVVRIWVRKGAHAVKYEPFIVSDIVNSSNPSLPSD